MRVRAPESKGVALRRSFPAAALLLAAALGAPLAEGADAAVASVGGRGPSDPIARISRAVQRILDEGGAAALSDATVAERLRTTLQPVPSVPPDVEAVLARDRNDVLGAVAFGHDDEAVARGTSVLEREQPRLSVTNRSEAAARSLADICLFLVRAELHRGDAPAAKRRASECLRVVPDLAPSGAVHPPDVMAVVGDARRAMTARLLVEAPSPGTAPCAVRVQGRLASPLPAEFELAPGLYSVRLECSRSQWIRDIVTKPGVTSRLSVSPELEASLRFDPALALERARPSDLLPLFEWLSIEDLWTVEAATAGFVVTRYSRRDARVVVRGTRSLSRGEGSSLPPGLQGAVTALSCQDAPCGAPRSRSGVPRTIGLVGGALGVAAIGASWVAYARFRAVDDELAPLRYDDPQHAALGAEYDRWRTASLVTAIGGSAVFAATAPLWLPERERVPWWAWSAGAAGVVAAGVGTAIGIGGGEPETANCPPTEPGCFGQPAGILLSPLLISQGVALVALPATYAVRRLLRSDTGALELGGSFGHLYAAWKQPIGF